MAMVGPEARSAATPDFIVIDVETACSRVSSICQIGIVGFRDGVEVFEYETLVDPLDRFSSFNTRIRGITCDHVADAPTFAEVHAAVNGHLSGRITVAHSFFDKGALGAACAIHERAVIETRWLDSVRVEKCAWPELPSHRLNVLTKFLGVRHKHHDALSDARAAGMVIVRAIEHTGIDLAGWLTPANTRGGRSPKPAAEGPPEGRACGDPRRRAGRATGTLPRRGRSTHHVFGRHNHDQARHKRGPAVRSLRHRACGSHAAQIAHELRLDPEEAMRVKTRDFR